jgi:peptidoglycan/xylan/chitin deacetylase (PgdA/CDA1 family)
MLKKNVSMAGLLWFMIFCNVLNSCEEVNNNDKKEPKQKDSSVAITTAVNKFSSQQVVYDSTKKYIYLTFDDGPQHGTVAVMELCKQLNVKATFFMVGMHTVQKSDGRQIVSNIRESYPQILLANHSYTHANGKYQYFYHHPEMAALEFYQTQEFLKVPYKIIRLPGNSAWVGQNGIRSSHLVHDVCSLLDSAGYNIVGWDVEWSFNHKTANPVQTPGKMKAIVDSALAKNHLHTDNYVVILSHDRMFRNPNYLDSLSKFIMLLKENPNYVFETVDHYPGLKKPL